MERPPGEPATAVAVAMVQNPLADAEEELDAAAAEDDAQGGAVSCGAGAGRRLPVWLVLGLVGWEGYGRLKAHALRDRLLEADTAEVPGIVKDMAPYRRWLDPLLHEAYAQAEKDNDPRKQLHASLALLPVDSGQVEYLYGRLLEAATAGSRRDSRGVVGPQGKTHGALVGTFWRIRRTIRTQRFRAACALAAFAPDDLAGKKSAATWRPRWSSRSRLSLPNGPTP